MGQSVVSTGVGGQTARAVLLVPTGDLGSRLLPKCSRAVLHRSIQTGCFVPPVAPEIRLICSIFCRSLHPAASILR